ncbi:glycoside hydrolase family 18 protein [Jaapia argillacea MUCL 33604]|uniref:Glycoside hydrolase family 18 protein n=1 Tax=Jaapia argillacea MUCL 33604 TaxID=933084 RepID=A0A067PPF7_9AGAM|nr:glycoside hydrolase family 18 protein [Jaapia argillacea MUCL 33604]
MTIITQLLVLALLAVTIQATPSSPFHHKHTRSSKKVASTWWASWHASDFPVSSLSWSKYSRVTYAFAVTTTDINTLDLGPSGDQYLNELVGNGHKHGVQVAVAIGGWTGSRYFSDHVSTAAKRTEFVHTVINLVNKYKLDGIDFDWEYPGQQGIGCNGLSTADTANFLSFLKLLRADPVGSKLVLSAATGLAPFTSASGTPSTDVSGFAQVLDFIEIMNYDVWGPWSSAVGPNAPLDDSCAPVGDHQGSAMSAVHSWTSAGMPAHQIVLGVAAYGHAFRVHAAQAIVNGKLAAYPAFDASNPPLGDKWDNAGGTDVCGVYEPSGGTFSFNGMIENGFLSSNGLPANGIKYRYGSCSQTPYVWNPTSEVMISYDNAQSFTAKGKYISSAGLRGFSMWEAGGDSHDILLNAIRSGGGY